MIAQLAGKLQSTSAPGLRLPGLGETPSTPFITGLRPEPSWTSPCPPSRIFCEAEGCLVLSWSCCACGGGRGL